MRQRLVMLAICLGMLAGSGCTAVMPNWLHPGRIDEQRIRATSHDPFPQNEGGPEIVGGRPRDFQKPRSEPVRSAVPRNMWGY